jgi:hypothetical protein
VTLVQASIPEATVASIGARTIDIGQVSLGPVTVGHLTLDNLHLGMTTGTALFENLRVGINLAMTLEWRVSVDILGIDTFSWSGTIDLGSHSIEVGLGDVALPGLQSFTLDLGSLTVDGAAAVLGPLSDLHLGALVADQVVAHGVQAPVPAFQIMGLRLGKVALQDLAVPGVAITAASVARVAGQAPPLAMTIPNLSLPEGGAGSVASSAIDASGTSNPFGFHADAGVLDVTLRLTPGATAHVDRLVLDNLRAAASIESIELTDVTVPYEILDLRLEDIGVTAISLPALEVS